MPVRKDSSGRRYVQAEVELPGTPEQVWQAIATGPGISSWFVPSEIEERTGGIAKLTFGPGMDSIATITDWSPPQRFALENKDNMGPGSPTVATEWTIEAQSGATCKVRVVHSWFADTEDWDQHFAGVEQGWAAFFRILTLYLAHFAGQKSQAFQLLLMTPLTSNEAWEALVGPLGIGNSQPGAHVRSADPALPFSGIVERVGPPELPELMLRLDTPGAGVAHVFVMTMGGSTCVSIRAFLYGDHAPDAAARFERAWSAWASAHVPSSTPEAAAAQETR